MATSFYNDKDEPIADALIKILLECSQEIPDFFSEKIPEEGEPIAFDDESGDEDDEEEGGATNGAEGGDAWGSGEPAVVPVAEETNGAWGEESKVDGW